MQKKRIRKRNRIQEIEHRTQRVPQRNSNFCPPHRAEKGGREEKAATTLFFLPETQGGRGGKQAGPVTSVEFGLRVPERVPPFSLLFYSSLFRLFWGLDSWSWRRVGYFLKRSLFGGILDNRLVLQLRIRRVLLARGRRRRKGKRSSLYMLESARFLAAAGEPREPCWANHSRMLLIPFSATFCGGSNKDVGDVSKKGAGETAWWTFL